MGRIALIVEHPEVRAVAEQVSVVEAAGIDQRVTIAPRTAEDWHYRLQEALAGLAEGDVVVVAGLDVLGLGAVALLDALQTVIDAQHPLVAVGDDIDTSADESFLAHIARLIAAIDAGRLAQARALIADAAHHGAVTPPKARLVDRAAWEQAHAEPGRH